MATSAELLLRYRGQDPAAATDLYARYADRLIRLARSRLSARLLARVDAEDVVQSAYRSFFLLARSESVVVEEKGDLWRLLVRITLRKICRNVRRHRADCRTVEREEAWPADEGVAALLAQEPTPAHAAELFDELRSVLEPLPRVQRRIVELRLQGHEIDDIATTVERTPRTVRRTLAALNGELQRRLLGPAPEPVRQEPPLAYRYDDIVLQRQLGEGGMGKVYRALWRPGNTLVAVKLLRKPLRQNEAAIARFLAEADTLARLGHPGIIAVHGMGLLPDGGHFLVMDLVDGSDLERQRRSGPVPVAQAVRWVREAALAVEHVHQQGIVHCDLKPSNLLLDAQGRIRVTDFGLARRVSAEHAIGGTPGFMAPEQRAGGIISPRTDVYGLGAVLYALLTGSAPEVPSVSAFGAEVPERVVACCMRCLAPQPELRLASAAEVAAALSE